MTSHNDEVERKVKAMHAEEEREKAIAETLPEGVERDEHRMRGERLSDEAWSIEEAANLDPVPSGLWPNP